MLLSPVLVLFLTENTFSESPQSPCALGGRLYGGVLRRQRGDHMRDLIRGRGFRWVGLERHHYHQQLGTRRGSRWVLAHHPSVSLFVKVQMWMISLMWIVFSSHPQPLLLISIGPVWKALLINPVRHKLVLVMSPFFVIISSVGLHMCSLPCPARCIWFHDITAPFTRNRTVLPHLYTKATAGWA